MGMGLKRMAYRLGHACRVGGRGPGIGIGSGARARLLGSFPRWTTLSIFAVADSNPEADSFEARLGVSAHSVGATEAGGVDTNVELLLPRLLNELPKQYKFLVPRPQFGAMINTAGKTSYGYAGVVWTLNILPQFFLEPS